MIDMPPIVLKQNAYRINEPLGNTHQPNTYRFNQGNGTEGSLTPNAMARWLSSLTRPLRESGSRAVTTTVLLTSALEEGVHRFPRVVTLITTVSSALIQDECDEMLQQPTIQVVQEYLITHVVSTVPFHLRLAEDSLDDEYPEVRCIFSRH
jgi:hypothetical protein